MQAQDPERSKLPVAVSGQPISTLRRCWYATHEDFRDQRATLLESRICMHRGGSPAFVRLVDLTLQEVEGILGAVTPRFAVDYYAPGKGRQACTFVNRADADSFIIGKTLHGKPAVVQGLVAA